MTEGVLAFRGLPARHRESSTIVDVSVTLQLLLYIGDSFRTSDFISFTMRPSSSLMRCFCRTAAVRPIPQSRLRIPSQPAASWLRPSAFQCQRAIPSTVRYESTAKAPDSPPKTSTEPPESRLDRDNVPAYELTFTCKQCSTRSSHRVSKQGYHHGTVLISCPGCKNRHLISDHLKVRPPASIRLSPNMYRYFPTSPSQSKTSCGKRASSSNAAP